MSSPRNNYFANYTPGDYHFLCCFPVFLFMTLSPQRMRSLMEAVNKLNGKVSRKTTDGIN